MDNSLFRRDERLLQQTGQKGVEYNAELKTNHVKFMKTNFFKKSAFGAAAAVLGLTGGLVLQTAMAQDLPPPPPPSDSATPVSPPALPPNIYRSSPLAQVIKLMQAGVSEEIIKNYVNNSGSTFNLDSDKIIYLKDIGLPDDIVTAMMQRDQVLQQQMAASTYQPPPPAPATESVVLTEAAPPPPAEAVTVNYFYDTLTPYGTWVDVEDYGRCWRPTVTVVNVGWQPYCDNGHWVYTDAGWYWLSTYSWGWAPFHYGRWFHHARFGWCWTPDTVWGPSWVTWRYSDDYCGWAPLPPRAVYREGIGFFYNGASVSIGFDFGLGASLFTFVSTRNFCDPHPWRYRVATREVTQIYNHTTVINNFGVDREHRTFVNHGIDPGRITAVTHADIHPIAIRESATPVASGERLGRDGKTLFVDRPHFTTAPGTGARGNPQPPMNRGDSPRTAPPSRPASEPIIGSAYRPPNINSPGNNNPEPRRNYQPESPAPLSSPRAPVTPAAPGAPRSPVASPTPIAPRGPVASPAPVGPSAPNNNANGSTDNRRYPSPRMQQIDPLPPRVNPASPANPPSANHYSPPVQPPPRSYEAPPAASAPPDVRQPSAPAASPSRSQGSGRDRNQNGQ